MLTFYGIAAGSIIGAWCAGVFMWLYNFLYGRSSRGVFRAVLLGIVAGHLIGWTLHLKTTEDLTMARKGITYDQVANAAAAVKARGSDPTISAVRVELGNEGSFTTISQHLAKWRDQAADQVSTKDLPPEVENKMMEALTVVWNIATRQANDDIAAIKQDATDRIDQIKKELAEAHEIIKELETELEKANAEKQKTKEDLTNTAEKLAETKGQLDATTTLYKELAQSAKQPADTKKVRQIGAKPGSGNKQA